MALLDELYPGSFRGAGFLVSEAVTDFGRKQIKHEYPNSDRQKIEDLGLKPRSFTLTVEISGPTQIDSRSYQQKKNDLLAALEMSGPGTLSHPFFFSSFQVVPRPGTITESMTRLGIATFQLTFDISNQETDPIPAPTSISQINQGLQNVNSAINSNVADNFGASTNLNFAAARELLGGLSSFVSSTTNTFNKLEAPANEFSSILSEFSEKVSDLIQNPQDLADSLQNIISTSAALYQTTEEALQVFTRFFEFGDDIIVLPDTTDERAERNLNNKTIKNATQASYLALCYQFAAQTEFTTVDDINALQDNLEGQYQKLVDDKANTDILNSLNDLRVLANIFLENEQLNASQIIDIKVKQNSLSVLAYQYYGDVENLQDLTNTLVDLNRPKSNNVTFVEGDLQILTQ